MLLSTHVMRRLGRVTQASGAPTHHARKFHLHRHQALELFLANGPGLDHVIRKASSAKEAADETDRLIETFGSKVRIEASVILPEILNGQSLPTGMDIPAVREANSSKEAQACAEQCLGKTLSTPGTGPSGRLCESVTITPAWQDMASHAFSLFLYPSRQTHTPLMELSSLSVEGDRQILAKLPLRIGDGAVPRDEFDAAAGELGLSNATEQIHALANQLWTTWKENDLMRLRVDAEFRKDDGGLVLLDIRAYADPFAAYRQADLTKMRDWTQVDPLERQAIEAGLFYNKKYGGNIAAFGYGAGVAMSTMDALSAAGGKPANFMDGGGGATKANVRAALEILLSDPEVKALFINSFGGITKTDLIAKGVVELLREYQKMGKRIVPTIVRLRGTGSVEAEQTIREATDLPELQFVVKMRDAAKAAVRAAAT